ncbi:MAG: hypothetical protein V7750_19185 [Sneathiella sp.]
MPFDYWIDTKQKLIHVIGHGKLTDDNLASYVHNLKHDPKFDPLFNLFTDLTQVTELELSIENIERSAKNPILSPSSEIIIVAPSDITYGTSRSFMAFKSPSSSKVHIFRTVDEAKKYLSLD